MLTEFRGLKIIPATTEHIDSLGFHDPDPAFARSDPSAPLVPGMTFSLIAPAGVVLIAGVIPMIPGTAMAWLIASPLIKKHPVTAAISCMKGLCYLRQKNSLHRIQIVIYPQFRAAIRFASWLGFKYEGTMKKYSPDKKDYYLYALTDPALP